MKVRDWNENYTLMCIIHGEYAIYCTHIDHWSADALKIHGHVSLSGV